MTFENVGVEGEMIIQSLKWEINELPCTTSHYRCFEQGDDINNLKHFLIFMLQEYKTPTCA